MKQLRLYEDHDDDMRSASFGDWAFGVGLGIIVLVVLGLICA